VHAPPETRCVEGEEALAGCRIAHERAELLDDDGLEHLNRFVGARLRAPQAKMHAAVFAADTRVALVEHVLTPQRDELAGPQHAIETEHDGNAAAPITVDINRVAMASASSHVSGGYERFTANFSHPRTAAAASGSW